MPGKSPHTERSRPHGSDCTDRSAEIELAVAQPSATGSGGSAVATLSILHTTSTQFDRALYLGVDGGQGKRPRTQSVDTASPPRLKATRPTNSKSSRQDLLGLGQISFASTPSPSSPKSLQTHQNITARRSRFARLDHAAANMRQTLHGQIALARLR